LGEVIAVVPAEHPRRAALIEQQITLLRDLGLDQAAGKVR